MTSVSIIGIIGRSRSGKDTVANIIQKECKHSYKIVRLSAPIKEAAIALFDFNNDQIEGALKEIVDPRWGVSPRQVFQKLTQEMMKYLGTDHFTRLLYSKYDANIIIPDIRYVHDIHEIHRRGGKIIYVSRKDLPVRHECENCLEEYAKFADFTVANDGTIEELREIINTFNL